MEDVYRHMTIGSDGDDRSQDKTLPAQVSPQFSLAYLREAKDAAMLLTCDGRVSFLNDAACALFDLGAVDAVKGRLLWELWPDLDAENVLKEALSAATKGDAVRFPAVTDRDGESTQWDVILSPVTNADGVIESVFGLVQPA